MLPKSVSPQFINSATIAVAVVLSASTLLLLLQSIERPTLWIVVLGCDFAISPFLVRTVLWYLGIAVRSRSIERFQADQRGGKEVAVDLPIQIRYSQTPIRIGAFIVFVVLGIFLSSSRFLKDDAPIAATGMFIMMVCILVSEYRQSKICEISEKGIRALGLWGWHTFVPWDELVRCEIIHDDENAYGDYFVLWDRAGHCRFNGDLWMAQLSRADRARIFGVLRSRFPEKGKLDRHAEPALPDPVSSAVWDRELDG